MKITAIEPQKNHPQRMNVHVDGAFRLALAAELVFAEHLHVGDEVNDARLATLERRDQAWKAREAAMNLLSFRARTGAELLRRLVEKGFAAEVADDCVSSLRASRLIDDASYATAFVRDRARLRPKGTRLLTGELRAKGVDAETAQAIVADVLEQAELTELDLARGAARKWRPRAGEEPRRARARLYGFLARRGFGTDAIRQVADEFAAAGAGAEDEYAE